jgi:hypothetical protein
MMRAPVAAQGLDFGARPRHIPFALGIEKPQAFP